MTALPPDSLSAQSTSDALSSPLSPALVDVAVASVGAMTDTDSLADPSRRLKRVAGTCALAALCTSYFLIAQQGAPRADSDDDGYFSMQRIDGDAVAQRRGMQQPVAKPTAVAASDASAASVIDAMQTAAAAAGLQVRSAKIDGSFNASARQLGLDSATALKVAHAFNGAIDFRRDIHEGDTITFLFRTAPATTEAADGAHALPAPAGHRAPAGAPVKSNARWPVAVKIGDGKNAKEIFLHDALGGEPLYYAKDGSSTKPAFSRYPVAFTRVSSPFSLHRLDPITHRWQEHDGVDLAAPYGTPIHASANGRVVFAGWKAGYGKVVEIRNAPPYSTRFAHMSRFLKGLHAGQTVKRGDVIGYVGSTGWATGPHLHYEVRVNDVAMNPLTVPLPRDTRLAGDEKQRFVAQAKALAALM
jgi:murein DD-endopeptidase MepM/ murein hydrolase activator NlpD